MSYAQPISSYPRPPNTDIRHESEEAFRSSSQSCHLTTLVDKNPGKLSPDEAIQPTDLWETVIVCLNYVLRVVCHCCFSESIGKWNNWLWSSNYTFRIFASIFMRQIGLQFYFLWCLCQILFSLALKNE